MPDIFFTNPVCMLFLGLIVVIPQLRCKLHSFGQFGFIKLKKKKKINGERNFYYESTIPLSCNFLCPSCLGDSLHIGMKQMVENKITS